MAQLQSPFSADHSPFVTELPVSSLPQHANVQLKASGATTTAQYTVRSQTPHALRNKETGLLVLPAIFEVKQQSLRTFKAVSSSLRLFLESEVDVDRLNQMHKHLWLAGLPQPPRSLQNQLEIGRQVRTTDRADMHMLWTAETIFLKPLPDFLLCHEIWEKHLSKESRLHAAALGLLRSYIFLIIRPSDHKVATDLGLLNDVITWSRWATLVSELTQAGILDGDVNPRYHYGELRLDRIHWTYRFCSKTNPSAGKLLRGYRYRYHDYGTFVRDNLAWLLTGFVYLAIALTALQVGLETDQLKDQMAFQWASYVFTVLALIAPAAVVGLVLLYTSFLILKNWIFTRKQRGKPSLSDDVWNNAALVSYKH